MSSSYRSNFGPQSGKPAQERRQHARTEDAATDAFIRKYMELAKIAMNEPQQAITTNAATTRAQHYLELADICLKKKRKEA